MPKLSGEKYYKREYKKTFQMVNDQCKTADQYAQVCAMSLSRCQLQFAAAAEFFPQVNILPGYERILADMEHFVCDGAIITNDMLQGYVDWCLEIKRVCEYTHIDYLSPWRKQFLPDAIQSLGEAFSNWMCNEMYREAIFNSDTRAFIKLGIDIVSCYEYSRFSIHPSNFHYFTFLRSRHQDIEDIMQKRETLRAFIASRERQATDEPDEEFEEAHEEYMRLGDLLHNESRKYWGEALAEHKRLKEEYRPPAPEDLVLSIQELERIRADVQFITIENPIKEDIRQRLQYYRTLDIASEETDTSTAANGNSMKRT